MKYETPDEMREEYMEMRNSKAALTEIGMALPVSDADTFFHLIFSKLQAREQYLVGEIGDRKTIQELIDRGQMPEVYQVHPCDIAFKDGWNLNNDRILSLINPQESKK